MLQPARTSADHPAGPSGDRRSRIVHRLRAGKTPDHSAVPEIVGQLDGAERNIRRADHIRDSERRTRSDRIDIQDADDERRRVQHGRLFERRRIIS